MDLREARRAAEKVARDRVAERVRIVGELGVLSQRIAEMTNGVDVAQQRAYELAQVALQAGQRIVDAATARLDEVQALYEAAHTAALAAGWSASELDEIGFTEAVAAGNPVEVHQ